MDHEGQLNGRPRNICNPAKEWKVLCGFINFILYNVMLKKLSFNSCGMTFE